jgi:acyl-CoA thioesterase FadM
MHEDEFTIIDDITAPGDAAAHYHLVDYQTQEMVSTLWSKYLAQARDGLAPTAVMQAMRRVTYSLDNEAFGGDELQRGIKATGRTRRGFTCSAALWHKGDGRMVHQAEIVTVFVEPGKGAVEIPEDFWAAVEKIEGREIGITERTG